jgi:hypothetical protein
MSNGTLIERLTRAVRLADSNFERVGGSSRHWVRDCFLPALESEGLDVVDTETNQRLEQAEDVD